MRFFLGERRGLWTTPALSIAAIVFAGLVAASDDPGEVEYRAGSEALRAEDYASAVAALGKAAELRPKHTDTWLKLGIAHAALENWEAAIADYGRLIEIDPQNAKAHHNLGNVYFRRGDFDAAAREYGRSLEIDPSYLLAAFHHGWTLRQIGRSEEAERAFRQCLDIPGDDARDRRTHVDCLFGLGSIRHRAGDYAASAKMMEQVLAVHRGHPEARYYLGMAYRQLGRLEEAERQLEIHRQMLSARRHAAPVDDQATDP